MLWINFMFLWPLISIVLCASSKFRLIRKLKASLGQEGMVALLEDPIISSQEQQWSGPIKSNFESNSNSQPLMNVQSNDHNNFDRDYGTFGYKSVPDHTDHDTVLNFARFAFDSYYEPSDKNWVTIPGWNVSSRFGWENTGIRGYLFEDDSLENLIIVIKGTSLSTPIGSGPTARLDKLNDNLMFSCCCAKAGWGWKAICDCPRPNGECSRSCLLKESNFDGSYYNLAQSKTIFIAVKEWYPRHTNIWMAGHSLGGALASLVALTNNLPAFAFESPGDLMYASRLGLIPKGSQTDIDAYLASLPIFHFGNTGDPIFLGQCTGVTSSCYWLDYALETRCHVGRECVYEKDPKPDQLNSYFASIQYHSIEFVIKHFIEPRKEVPSCLPSPDCLANECPRWKFID